MHARRTSVVVVAVLAVAFACAAVAPRASARPSLTPADSSGCVLQSGFFVPGGNPCLDLESSSGRGTLVTRIRVRAYPPHILAALIPCPTATLFVDGRPVLTEPAGCGESVSHDFSQPWVPAEYGHGTRICAVVSWFPPEKKACNTVTGGRQPAGVPNAPAGTPSGPAGPPSSAPTIALAPTPTGRGYWELAADGAVFGFGDARTWSAPGPQSSVGRSAAGLTVTAAGRGGYRIASPSGQVAPYGDPGPTSSLTAPPRAPVVGIAAQPNGPGYWLVASDGGVFAFGGAPFLGSAGALRLSRPIVGMAATPSGQGYWLVAADGGIFSFGDASFLGSTGALRLSRPIVGMAAAHSGRGYWLVASDGGVFAFGNAPFLGSTGSLRLSRPIVGMAAAPGGQGYWLVASDGGVFAFGNAPFLGRRAG